MGALQLCSFSFDPFIPSHITSTHLHTTTMSKTPGGQQPSAKYEKQQAEAQGLGAPNAPGHTEGTKPLDQPAAADSGIPTNVGLTEITNNSAGKSGGLNTEGAFGTPSIAGAPTANIPAEDVDTKKNA